MSHYVACLDVWTPGVREVVRRTAPPELELHFAESYDDAEQMGLVENAEFLLPGWAAVTEPMLARARKLRMIQKWGIGYDRIVRHYGFIDVDAVQQALAAEPEAHTSPRIGTSGTTVERLFDVMAKAFSSPLRTCPPEVAAVSIIMSMLPASKSCEAGPALRYGTNCI